MVDAKLTKNLMIKINAIIAEKDQDKKLQRIDDLISLLRNTNPDDIDKKEIDPFVSVLVRNVSDENQLRELITLLDSIVPQNKGLLETKVVDLYKNGYYDDVVKIITSDNYFCSIDSIISLLVSSSGHIERYDAAALYLSKCGRYEEKIVQMYAERNRNPDTTKAIIEGYVNGNHCEMAIKFIMEIMSREQSELYLGPLINCSIKTDDKDGMRAALDFALKIDISDADLIKKLVQAALSLGEYTIGKELAKNGLKLKPADKDLMKWLALCLSKSGNYGEAIETYKDLLTSYPDDIDATIDLMDLLYEHGKASEYLYVVEKIGRNQLRPLDYIRLIQLMKASGDIGKAVELAKEAYKKFPSEDDVIIEYARIVDEIGNKGESFDAYSKLFDKGGKEAQSFILNYLFSRERYEEFVKRFESSDNEDVKDEFKGKLAASFVYLGFFDNFNKLVKENKNLLDDPDTVDSVFYKVRDKEALEILNSLDIKGSYVSVVLDRLQGREIRGSDYLLDYAVSKCSKSIAYISAETYFRRMISLPDKVRSALSTNCLSEIYDIFDILTKIKGGTNSGIYEDRPRYLYCFSSTFIDAGKLDDAYKLLQRYEKEVDPFYYFTYAKLLWKSGRNKEASRMVEKAIELFPNIDFHILHLNVDPESCLESIQAIFDIDAAMIPYDVLQSLIEDHPDLVSEAVNFLISRGIDDVRLLRLSRDVYLKNKDIGDALKVSSRIISQSSESRDIAIHYRILKEIDLDAALAFMKNNIDTFNGKEELIEAGELMYSKRKYEDAISAFRKAIRLGVNPLSIPHYLDSLIETGSYAEAEDLVGRQISMDVYAVKLFFREGKISEIVNYLTDTQEKDNAVLRYIVQQGWITQM